MYCLSSAKLPEPFTKYGTPLVADSHSSRQNGGNRENEDPQIVVLDHAKMERKQVPEQSEFEHAAPAYAKKEQIALTSKFSTKIQKKS